ncbi:hypothetical protein EJ06DRAFT_526549 [Trichodelitschia bisporula]|uniref:Uncharacterized protein n=1 Tax=Trichodelitschia bisporula TaxID=703511 RepID=A0A6G1I8S5_9PEZI|nr:hypothetical protein EJ06DRAFT_526549 [Trichodelitschia bisporula]
MKLSDWPPPVKLLLINRQLYAEAVQWHYARTTLFLNVCQGFSHLSFFEDMLDMIQKQPHSPLRKVRKIFVRFTWDGVFLDAVNAPNTDMLDSVLQCRSQAAYNTIAAGADNLELLTIQWMDTKCDEVAIERRTRITAPFLTLAHRINRAGVPIKVVESEYWAKPGESFARGHPLHTRRVEFWGIVRGGKWR